MIDPITGNPLVYLGNDRTGAPRIGVVFKGDELRRVATDVLEHRFPAAIIIGPPLHGRLNADALARPERLGSLLLVDIFYATVGIPPIRDVHVPADERYGALVDAFDSTRAVTFGDIDEIISLSTPDRFTGTRAAKIKPNKLDRRTVGAYCADVLEEVLRPELSVTPLGRRDTIEL